MSLKTCSDCSTKYALDLDACPHCGSNDATTPEGFVSKRHPLFCTLTCKSCGCGPWTVRLTSVTSGLVEIPTLACASCGSRVPIVWPPEEDEVPKNHVGRGPTDARETDLSPDVDASEPQVVAEDDLGRQPFADAPEDEGDAERVPSEEKSEEDAPEAEESTADYDSMTLSELRAQASDRGLPSYGNKGQLVERLREADAS